MTHFFEAFPDLSVDDKLYGFFAGSLVEKVSASKTKMLAYIYIKCDQLLHYRIIKKMEQKLYKQVFRRMGIRPRLEVSYPFASGYGTDELISLCEDSLKEELREINTIDYMKFCREPFQVSGDVLTLTCDDDFLCRERSGEIRDFFTARLKRRFDRELEIRFEYVKRERKAPEEPETYLVYDEPELAEQGAAASHSVARQGATTTSQGAVEPQGAVSTTSHSVTQQSVSRNVTSEKSAPPQKPAFSPRKNKYRKSPKDPSVFYGRNVEGEVIPVKEIVDEIGEVVIEGMIRSVDQREIKGEKLIVIFAVTDFTDTILAKIFIGKEQAEEQSLFEFIKKGNFVRLKGMASFDTYDKEIRIGNIAGIKEIPNFRVGRADRAPLKRVELHAHTQMSEMDGMTNCAQMVRRAHDWGHAAIAITDHGVVQAFPEASHAMEKFDDDFKVIYGCEAYLVDDLDDAVKNAAGQSLRDSFVVFDLETTGFSPTRNRIIEIGAVKLEEGKITDRFSTFVNPGVPIPPRITEVTSINDGMVADAPGIEQVLPEFLAFCEGCVLVAHNASFDYSFICKKGAEQGLSTEFAVVDTVGIARVLFPHMAKYTLDAVAKALKISLVNHHRAVEDAEATAEIFEKMIPRLEKQGISNLDALYERTHCAPEIIKKKPSYHAIILAKNEVGRVNLYRLVSMGHLDYFFRRPRIPKSQLMKWREGLIVGSACEAGELCRAILDDEDDERIEELVKFYDYLEIQPLANNEFMLASEKGAYEHINSWEDLKDINRRIVKLGETYNKPVCATCDVHFLDPEDAIYREILFACKKMKSDEDSQPPLYLRTTEEMLQEFSYLGEEKAMEVVVTNTNKIADMVEKMSPVFPDKCPPVIPNSDQELREICYRKATSMYGEDLPPQVSERLEHELNSIIKNGFAVMYIIAQKLVWKSNEDGYLVGSRGSVGSSFVATMSGITEVNPLPAHYYCKKCHYSDFDSEQVKAFAGSSGYDMPPRDCPVCGEPLVRDGHDIPFETFLGFYGDKEPDIDLNFSGEYQSKAHNYTEVIFGAGQTFRAGTIGTLADKTAYGYVKKFYEEQGIHKRNEEIERLIEGCVGVRRATGQHPGGIVVLPMGWDIYTFTPVQHPANDMDTAIITTHFDYHSIDHNLLKLDILGHDDPTMIRMLEDITGVDAKGISLDDPKVLSLFADTSALELPPDALPDCDLGSLGIPEFGTEFVMQMLRDTKPKNFSDLVRISGLSHGTDVWLNNAQYYIARGDCTLSTAICTRDDIMTYLIHTGVENGQAFKIMESVRKGKGLTPEMEKAMTEAGVEPWYIESCKKIKYMFPKAHAVAYVMMAFRIAYFKVYYPLAYYAAFFSIRAKAFDYEIMCQGKERLEETMKDYKRRMNELSAKDQAAYGDMKIVQEMYARGYEFTPIDIFTAQAKNFQIVDGKIMPSLNSIDGMGDKAAEGVVDAVKDGPFTSCENFKNRCKVTGTIVDKMREMGLLGNLPLNDQMSLLDFI